MRPGMLPFQDIGCPARTDECEDVHVAAFHERRGNLGTTAVNEIDHAGREACRKGSQQGLMQQHAEFRRLHYRRIAHDERRDQRGVHFVQGVVERPHRKADPKRRVPDLCDHPAIQAEAGVRTIDFFQRHNPELGILPLGTHSIFVQLLSQSLYGKTTERSIPMAAGQ
jgi:hypothetical protein